MENAIFLQLHVIADELSKDSNGLLKHGRYLIFWNPRGIDVPAGEHFVQIIIVIAADDDGVVGGEVDLELRTGLQVDYSLEPLWKLGSSDLDRYPVLGLGLMAWLRGQLHSNRKVLEVVAISRSTT